jgi:hypothetical protein
MAIAATTLLIGGAIASATAAGAKAGGRRAAAKRAGLSPEEQKELEELQKLRETGQLGLTDAEQQRLDQSLLTQRGGMMRQQQATALQQAAQAGPVSGRDVFLREQTQQAGQQQMVRDEAALRQQVEASAAEQQRARQAFLRQQQIASDMAKAQATADMFSDPLSVLGRSAMEVGEGLGTGDLDPTLMTAKTDEELLAAAGIREAKREARAANMDRGANRLFDMTSIFATGF